MKIFPMVCNHIYSRINKPQKTKVSFGQNNADVFIKNREVLSHEKLLEILNGDFRKINKEFLDNLSDEEFKFCLDWAKGDEKRFSGMFMFSSKAVLPEDVRDIVKYTDHYYSGLQRVTYGAGKDMSQVMIVGIGQSPVAAVKLLELSGVKAGFCPISGLTRFKEPVEKYVTKDSVDKYFSYWINFGFDINDLFGDNLIVFTDHRETGKTFENFKKIINKIISIKKDEMRKKGKKPAKIKYFSLSDIYKLARKESEEKRWGNAFEESVYHTSYLKTLYSPLFKLPLPQFGEIAQLYKEAKNSDRYIRFNKLAILMYDELHHKRTDVQERPASVVENDRQFRLSFYTPEENEILEETNGMCFYNNDN